MGAFILPPRVLASGGNNQLLYRQKLHSGIEQGLPKLILPPKELYLIFLLYSLPSLLHYSLSSLLHYSLSSLLHYFSFQPATFTSQPADLDCAIFAYNYDRMQHSYNMMQRLIYTRTTLYTYTTDEKQLVFVGIIFVLAHTYLFMQFRIEVRVWVRAR